MSLTQVGLGPEEVNWWRAPSSLLPKGCNREGGPRVISCTGPLPSLDLDLSFLELGLDEAVEDDDFILIDCAVIARKAKY